MKRKSRKAVLKYLVFVAVFLALYLFAKVDFAGYVLLALLLWLGFSLLVICFTGKKLSVNIQGPDYLQKQEAGSFQVKIQNDSLLPVVSSKVTLAVENLVTGKHSQIRERIVCLPKKTKEISFRSEEDGCGCLRMEVRELCVTDPFGIFSSVREVTGVHDCYVMPQISDIQISPDAFSHYDMESYRYASERKGNDPSETFGLHAYQPGDSIKAIHWKLSGKMGELVIREGGFPVENSLILLLDRRIPVSQQEKRQQLEHDMKQQMKRRTKKRTTKREEPQAHAQNRDQKIMEAISRETEAFVSLSHTLAARNIPHSVAWYQYDRGAFFSRKICDPEDVFELLPELLTSSVAEDAQSLADRYLASERSKTETDRTSYLYVTSKTADVEKEVERLRTYGKVIVYRT